MDDNKITCPRCEGSGLCIECEGKGFIPCPDCNENISPSCKKCSGTGKIFVHQNVKFVMEKDI